jgi:predicted O-linked N-acetylglucosamine transferase (SPINDLY family)
MNEPAKTVNLNDRHQQAYQHFLQGEYHQAAGLYEQAIEVEPEVKSHYWYLGLALLLQGQEAEAQTAWMFATLEGTPEEIEAWTQELFLVLNLEAERREASEDYSTAWGIRQHIREINPLNVQNLLRLIQLAVRLEILNDEQLESLGIIELFQTNQVLEIDELLFLEVLRDGLRYNLTSLKLLELVETYEPYAKNIQACIDLFISAALKIRCTTQNISFAIRYAEICLRLQPDNLDVLWQLAVFYQDTNRDYDRGIEIAKRCYEQAPDLARKVFGKYLVIRGLLGAGGHWYELTSAANEYKSLVLSMVDEPTPAIESTIALSLLLSAFPLPYLKDDLKSNRQIQNQLANLCQQSFQTQFQEQVNKYQNSFSHKKQVSTQRPLKIAYLSHCLSRHSIGWIARWLIQHHDRQKFELYAYLIHAKNQDFLQDWFTSQVNRTRKFGMNGNEMAEAIHQDEIDILIDLDSITLDVNCAALALKPAPIQVAWLGWDAPGLSAVDYFIADPYVLPDSAQTHYQEKIWRLPQTYVAVNGFEVGLPTLRREHLNIPTDAIVFFSSQPGYKRHPDAIHLQMKILKEVPNSYFLVKGIGDQNSIKEFLLQIAEAEGINVDRLRFLPLTPSEEIHRANLSIADIVLDTYPYNGATTTLETLWMEVPLVTRVGETFSSRNSYTMLKNVGVAEGIAWTDEEYVEWGIRFGTDAALRQKVAWQLRQAKNTAPLWNGKQFARDMEAAYEQMWQQYINS